MPKPVLFPCPSSLFLEINHSCKKIFSNLTPGLFKGLRDRDHHPMWIWHGNQRHYENQGHSWHVFESQAWQVFCVRNANQNERQKQGAGGGLFQGDFVWSMKIEEVQEMWKKKEIWRNMRKYARNNFWSWWFYGRVLMIGRNPNPNCGNFFLGPNKKRLDSSSHAIRLTICTRRCWMTEDLDCKYRQI